MLRGIVAVAMDEATLLDKLRKIEALHAGATTEGEIQCHKNLWIPKCVDSLSGLWLEFTMLHQGSLDELRSRLEEALSSLPDESRDATINELSYHLDTCQPDADRSRRVDVSYTEHDTWYAVHDSDLELLKEAGVVAAATIALLQEPAGVIAGMVVLLWNYRRKRIRLDGRQALVLKTLKKAPEAGWTPGELNEHLPLKQKPDTDRVRDILVTLTDIRQTNGETTSLVNEKIGRWRAVDV